MARLLQVTSAVLVGRCSRALFQLKYLYLSELRVHCAAFKACFASSDTFPAPLIAAAPSTADGFAAHFQAAIISLLGPARCCLATSCASVEKLALEVTACACIIRGNPSSHRNADTAAADPVGEQTQQLSATLPLRVWRYANRVPLLEADDDSLSCATAGALRALRWAEFGYKLRLALDPLLATENLLALRGSNDAGSGDVAAQKGFPNWQLQAQRPELTARLQEQSLQVLLLIDLSGAKGKP
jgi:hypothetical protein